jgi:hypothetical protein
MSRYVLIVGLVALAGAIYGAVGLLEPGQLGWTAPTPMWAKIVLALLLLLPIVWLIAFRHHLQSRWALTDDSPLTMYAQVEVEGSSTYYVCLRAAPDAPVLHRLRIERPHGSLEGLRAPQAARVFIDSRGGKPLVVELHGHRLWTMAA